MKEKKIDERKSVRFQFFLISFCFCLSFIVTFSCLMIIFRCNLLTLVKRFHGKNFIAFRSGSAWPWRYFHLKFRLINFLFVTERFFQTKFWIYCWKLFNEEFFSLILSRILKKRPFKTFTILFVRVERDPWLKK